MMATVVPVLVEPYSVTLRFALDAFEKLCIIAEHAFKTVIEKVLKPRKAQMNQHWWLYIRFLQIQISKTPYTFLNM